jgi:hypothetical protein
VGLLCTVAAAAIVAFAGYGFYERGAARNAAGAAALVKPTAITEKAAARIAAEAVGAGASGVESLGAVSVYRFEVARNGRRFIVEVDDSGEVIDVRLE